MTDLTQETLARLDTIRAGAQSYSPSDETLQKLTSSILVELIAPAAEGKSRIMDEVAALDSDFSYVTGLTTRPPEERDVPGRYRYFNSDQEINELADSVDRRELVQYVTHPTTKHIYGSSPEDYRTAYCLLDTLYSAVADLDEIPFKAIFKIAIVSDGAEWMARFLERYPDTNEERAKRLKEAKQCLEWQLHQDPQSIIWIENKKGEASNAAQELVSIVRGKRNARGGRVLAESMYNAIQDMI